MPDSFQNPVGAPDPYGKYRVVEIQKDRGTHHDEPPPPPPRRSILAAFAVHVFKKFFELFEEGGKKKPAVFAPSDLLDHLKLLKASLERLAMEDHSQDSSFLNQLANIWLLLLEDTLQFTRRSPIAGKVNAFIDSIQDYPEKEEHSLGYYLSEYAGQKWLPFPYMEMIRSLWADHQNNPENSRLSQWCNDLDEILSALGEDEQQP